MATQPLDEEIISQVRRHSCLYDPREADYKDADRKAAVWREMATRLGISGKKTSVTPSIQWLHFVCSYRVRAPLALPARSLHARTQAKTAGTRRTESRLAAGAAHALHSGFHQTPQVATFHCKSRQLMRERTRETADPWAVMNHSIIANVSPCAGRADWPQRHATTGTNSSGT